MKLVQVLISMLFFWHPIAPVLIKRVAILIHVIEIPYPITYWQRFWRILTQTISAIITFQ
jgi:hypothetical protein